MSQSSLAQSHRRIARRYYYSIGIILFLLGVTVMLVPHAMHREGELWRLLGELGSFLALIVALHFIYELLIKRHDHDLLIDDLEAIVGGHLNDINDSLALSRARNYPGQQQAYAAVVEAIVRTSARQRGEKALLLAALHGHSGKRRTMRPALDTGHAAFANQIFDCIKSAGPDKWYVRELYNITDEDRLKMVLDRLEKAGDAEGYEVRAFCLQNVLPQLTPLIIGDEELFIGLDDPTYYGVKSAFRMTGAAFVRTATEYYESLWNDKRAIILRSGIGADRKQIDRLRQALRALNVGR